MTRLANEPTTEFSVLVEQVARLIRHFDQRQKALLIQLVPELRTIRPEAADVPVEQDVLLTYFERKRSGWQECQPLRGDDPFLAGLTVAEFFALPEEEQARLWDQAHAEAWRESAGREQPVQADALPAR
jgi:hypothetical protein